MVKEIQHVSIKEILSNIMLHPMLRDVTLEQAVIYTLRFLGLHGYPKLYEDRIGTVEIHDFRGLLPCELVSIVQVKDVGTGICLRSMTDNFPAGMDGRKKTVPCEKIGGGSNRGVIVKGETFHHGREDVKDWYIPGRGYHMEEPAFKTQGRVIYTSFPEGMIEIAYKGIPVDEDGFPLLIDNEVFKAALEQFIKKEVFTYKFDQGKISAGVLQNTQQEYAWRAAQLSSEMTIPSVSEMESITRAWNSLIPRMREFDNGFVHMSDREYIRRH